MLPAGRCSRLLHFWIKFIVMSSQQESNHTKDSSQLNVHVSGLALDSDNNVFFHTKYLLLQRGKMWLIGL